MSKITGKILGLDNGFRFTKTSERVRFESTIMKGEDIFNEDTLQVKIRENNYVVGDPNGEYISDSDKLKTEENKENLRVCTLTSIGMSYPTEAFIDVRLVVGVPVAFYKKQKDEFKELMMSFSDKIFINKIGFEQTIVIKDVLVYPQSAGLLFKKVQTNPKVKTETSLVIDIGGGTWDVSLFKGLRFIEGQTFKAGMLILHGKIAQFINSNYYTTYKKGDIYDLLQRGYFTANGTRNSMDVTKEVCEKFIKTVADDIKDQFHPEDVDNICLIGGGADEVEPYLDKHIDNIRLEDDAQFINADCFELMGRMAWSA